MSDGDGQLKLLMDYTKFHIGMYVSIFSALVAFLSYKKPEVLSYRMILASVVCFFIAGAAGGVIGSNIPNNKDWESFAGKGKAIGPWGRNWLKYETWAQIEHGAFWIGAIIAGIGLIAS